MADAEERHAACAHGKLTEAFWVDALTGRQKPSLAPLCLWMPDPHPPAMARAWGGLIELEDCATCPAWEALPPAPLSESPDAS